MIVYICGMVYYYVICNYVIDTPIGIWPLILYCFLLAVPGDIALSVLGAVIAKRVRPVVLNIFLIQNQMSDWKRRSLQNESTYFSTGNY